MHLDQVQVISSQVPEALLDASADVRGAVIVGGEHGLPGWHRRRAAALGGEEELAAARAEVAADQLLAAPVVDRGVDQVDPRVKQLAERLSERARRALAQGRKAPSNERLQEPLGKRDDERERLLEHALHLSVVEGYRELSAPQIADAANVSIDAFFELFDGKEECFLAALDMLGERLLELAADPELRSTEWPYAVRRTIRELMQFLAEHPVYAQTIAEGAYAAGPEAIERNLTLAHGIAARLTEGAPEQARSALAVQGVAGALSHTVRCHVASGQIQLLSVLSDYLTYIVLTPFIGAEEAAALVIEEA